MKRIAIIAAAVLGSVAAVLLVAITVLIAGTAAQTAGTTFDEPPAAAPLSRLQVTRTWGITKEVFVTAAPGVSVCDIVACDVFAGFDGKMSPEAARQAIGAPSGHWVDPWYGVEAPYYDQAVGRVSLCRAPDSGGFHWETVGYPKESACERIFHNAAARAQILGLVSSGRKVQVNVLRSVGWGGISVFVSPTGCDKLILTAGESAPIEPPNDELQRTRPAQATEPRR